MAGHAVSCLFLSVHMDIMKIITAVPEAGVIGDLRLHHIDIMTIKTEPVIFHIIFAIELFRKIGCKQSPVVGPVGPVTLGAVIGPYRPVFIETAGDRQLYDLGVGKAPAPSSQSVFVVSAQWPGLPGPCRTRAFLRTGFGLSHLGLDMPSR